MAPQNHETNPPAAAAASKAPVVIKNALNQEVTHRKVDHEELLSVFPDTKYPPIPELPYEDCALKADPTMKNLLADATITHLSPKIGSEIAGLQLHELSDAQKDELALLVAQRGVVFFRDQAINIDQQLALGRYYGPLHIHQFNGHPEGYPEVVVVENSVEKSAALLARQLYDPTNGWHGDVTYQRQSPSYTIFKLLTSPDVGGDTLWASGYEAYERLTPPFQRFIEGLTAIHSSVAHCDRAAKRGFNVRRPVVEFEHPIVRTHPVTGRKTLFVNKGFTTHIPQLSAVESDAVLRFLHQHVAQGHEFQVRYRWTKDAVAIWDNRNTFHYATFDYLPGNRHALRVTPHGEIPSISQE
ncbi:Poly adp-ribose [Globisporangium polare]